MKKAEPLPKYGKGFILVPIVIVLTIIGIVLGHINPITNGIPSAAWVRYLYIGFGAVILFLGIRYHQSISTFWAGEFEMF
ncbi:MAG: hypothetical protein IKM72_02515, partial [Oscillospiraceae bacterium]|nr:hypothetical protein [Oscillospiraceae bacterium]